MQQSFFTTLASSTDDIRTFSLSQHTFHHQVSSRQGPPPPPPPFLIYYCGTPPTPYLTPVFYPCGPYQPLIEILLTECETQAGNREGALDAMRAARSADHELTVLRTLQTAQKVRQDFFFFFNLILHHTFITLKHLHTILSCACSRDFEKLGWVGLGWSPNAREVGDRQTAVVGYHITRLSPAHHAGSHLSSLLRGLHEVDTLHALRDW